MLIGGGGGWVAITGNTYQIKTMAVTPASASGMTASDIEKLFSYLDPSSVAEAGKTHTAAAKTLQSIADSLVTHAQALAGAWSGTTAQASIAALEQLHQTAVQLAQTSAQTGQVLTWLGENILPYYKNWKAPSNGIMGTIESWFGGNPQDHAAQQVMVRLNDRLSQANAALPDSVSISLPKIGQPGRAPAAAGGSGLNRGAGAAARGVALTSAVGGAVSPTGNGGGVHPGGAGGTGGSPSGGVGVASPGSGGHTAPPAHLAGVTPGGSTPTGAGGVPGSPGGVPGGGGLPAPGGGGLPSGPGPIGPGSGQGSPPGAGGAPGVGNEPPGGVGILPGEPGGSGEPGTGVGEKAPGGAGAPGEDAAFAGESSVVGSDGMIGTAPGMAEGEFGPGNAGATGFVGADDAATQPGGELPMTGNSGGGRREHERYRQAWMAEDLDTWEGETAPAG